VVWLVSVGLRRLLLAELSGRELRHATRRLRRIDLVRRVPAELRWGGRQHVRRRRQLGLQRLPAAVVV
jgi:hypothetical protein